MTVQSSFRSVRKAYFATSDPVEQEAPVPELTLVENSEHTICVYEDFESFESDGLEPISTEEIQSVEMMIGYKAEAKRRECIMSHLPTPTTTPSPTLTPTPPHFSPAPTPDEGRQSPERGACSAGRRSPNLFGE